MEQTAAVSRAELTRRLKRHEQRRLGRAAFRRLATHHQCTTHCTFFGVRVRYGYRAAHKATLTSPPGPGGGGSDAPTTATSATATGTATGTAGTSANPAAWALDEEWGTCTIELDGECVERVSHVVDDASRPLPHRVTGHLGVAEFGAPLDCLKRRAPVVRGDGDGCGFASVSYAGAVAVLPRGGCSFVSKAMHAQVFLHPSHTRPSSGDPVCVGGYPPAQPCSPFTQASGALGVLMYDPKDTRDSIFTMADDGNGSAVLIPVLMLPRSSAAQLLQAIDERPPLEVLRQLAALRGDPTTPKGGSGSGGGGSGAGAEHASGLSPLSLLHAGQECWWGCHETPGACASFCGADGACCRRSSMVKVAGLARPELASTGSSVCI